MMAQFWPLETERRALFESVQPERWVVNGRQGLVWVPDLL
jgi:hypothetical protein